MMNPISFDSLIPLLRGEDSVTYEKDLVLDSNKIVTQRVIVRGHTGGMSQTHTNQFMAYMGLDHDWPWIRDEMSKHMLVTQWIAGVRWTPTYLLINLVNHLMREGGLVQPELSVMGTRLALFIDLSLQHERQVLQDALLASVTEGMSRVYSSK